MKPYLLHWQADTLPLSHLGADLTQHTDEDKPSRKFLYQKTNGCQVLKQFSRAGDGAEVTSTATETGTPKARKIDMRSAREGICGASWTRARDLGFILKASKENSPADAGDTGWGSIPGSGRPPWRRKWQPPPVFLPGKIAWTEAGYSPQGCRRVDLAANQQQTEA